VVGFSATAVPVAASARCVPSLTAGAPVVDCVGRRPRLPEDLRL
jgi:hypothetical protein